MQCAVQYRPTDLETLMVGWCVCVRGPNRADGRAVMEAEVELLLDGRRSAGGSSVCCSAIRNCCQMDAYRVAGCNHLQPARSGDEVSAVTEPLYF